MMARILACAVGLWLMVSPVALGYFGPARPNDQTVGPMVASLALVAMWEVTRGVRWANLVLGFWLMLAPLVLHYPTWTPVVNSVVCSLILLYCSIQPGKITQRFGGGWRGLFS